MAKSEEKSHAYWTNRHILEQMNLKEKKQNKSVSIQSTNKESMVERNTNLKNCQA